MWLYFLLLLAVGVCNCEDDGPPPMIHNLTATENGPGSLRFTWHMPPRNGWCDFKVHIINTMTSSHLIVPSVLVQYNVVTIEDTASCDVYRFRVSADIIGLATIHSSVVARRFPSLPVLTLMKYSLEKLVLKVSFRATTCPDYPVTGYFLVLHTLPGGLGDSVRMPVAVNIIDGIACAEVTLERYQWFSFHVEATNRVGVARLPPQEIIESLIDITFIATARPKREGKRQRARQRARQ